MDTSGTSGHYYLNLILEIAAGGAEFTRDALADGPRELDRNGVADLAHGLGPRSAELEIVWKGLQPGGLADGEIATAAIRAPKHVLAAGHAMDASLDRLGGLIQRASHMTGIDARAGLNR